MSWLLDGRPLRRVLVTRLRYLGDIAMSTVVLTALRRGDPQLEIAYLCEVQHAPLLAAHPLLARVHALVAHRAGSDAAARRAGAGAATSGQADPAVPVSTAGTLLTLQRLRRQRYDLAIDLFFNPRSAWLLRLAGIPVRCSGAIRGYRRRLYTHLAPSPPVAERPGLYAVAGGGLGEHLSRLAPLRHADGRPFLKWLEETWTPGSLAPMVARPHPGPAAREALARVAAKDAAYTLLAPAATWRSKQWPADRWLQLAEALLHAGRHVVVLGPPGGPGPYAGLAAAIPAGRGGLLPQMPLSGALQVVGGAELLVTVDGGIMHAAVAMQVPTVAIFGPTDPQLWFPYERLGPYRVVAVRPACHPCHRHDCDAFVCLPELTAARVFGVIATLLDRGGA